MRYEPYIRSGKSGIDLYYVFSLLDYDDLPIVFVVRDEDWNIYLCDCTEFRFGKQHWVIARTSLDIIKSIIMRKVSVYYALCAMDDQIILAECDLGNDQFEQSIVAFSSVPSYRLPEMNTLLTSVDEETIDNLIQLETEISTQKTRQIVMPSIIFETSPAIVFTGATVIRDNWEDKKGAEPNIAEGKGSLDFDYNRERRVAA